MGPASRPGAAIIGRIGGSWTVQSTPGAVDTRRDRPLTRCADRPSIGAGNIGALCGEFERQIGGGRGVNRVLSIAAGSLVMLLTCSCVGEQAKLPTSSAEAVLVGFLSSLADGNYDVAAGLYGGSYGTLRDWNPVLDPEAVTNLWENGCTKNGLQCLELRRVVKTSVEEDGVFRFDVELSTAEGELFERGPCCGEDPASSPPVSVFEFTVEDVGGRFVVTQMPPYVP